jgi:hypothetical protein
VVDIGQWGIDVASRPFSRTVPVGHPCHFDPPVVTRLQPPQKTHYLHPANLPNQPAYNKPLIISVYALSFLYYVQKNPVFHPVDDCPASQQFQSVSPIVYR